MAIVSIGSATNNNSSGTATVVLPAGVQADDLIEVVLHINGPKTSSDGNGATPFTELLVDRTYNGPSAQVDHYYRIATGAEPGTLSFPLSGSDRWVAICTVDRGVDTSNPYDVAPTSSSEGTGSGDTSTTNQLVTLTNGALMKSYSVNDSSSVSFTSLPSGWTTIANQSGRQLIAMVSKEMTTAGTQAGISYVQSTSNGVWLNNIYALKPAASGTTFNSSVVDAIGISDTNSRTLSYIRSDNEAVGISDANQRIQTSNRSITDALGLTDVISITKQLNRTLSDNVGLLDVVTVSTVLNRSLQDSIGILDVLENQLTITISLTDTVGVEDSITRQLSVLRNLVSAEGIADIVNKVSTYAHNVSDDIGITDSLEYQLVISISLSDSVGLSDSTSRVHTAVQNIPETVGLVDSTNRQATIARNVSDIEGVSDSIARTLSYVLNLSDTIGVQDAISRQLTSLRSIVDNMGVVDANDESSTSIDFSVNVQSYIGALYFGLYVPTAGSLITTEYNLSDSVSITDKITVLVGTSFGYNPDLSLSDVLDIKLSVSAVDSEKGTIESVYDDKMQIKTSDIFGQLGEVGDYKPTIEQV